MIRLFDQHRVRRQKELDGMWRFVREDGKEYDLPVPGVWEQHPELMNYRGKGTFYKKIYLPQATNLRLEFKGVSHTGDVYLDDVFVVHHYNAFTPFSGIVKNVAAGEHTIKVCVDNTFGEHSALHTPNDYYTYGGITRPVAMEELGKVYIKNVHFNPYRKAEKWYAKVEVWVENLSEEEKQLKVCCGLAGKATVGSAPDTCIAVGGKNAARTCMPLALAAGTTSKISWEQEYPGVDSWNVGEGNLYFLETLLKSAEGVVVDDFIDRVGFREVTLRGNRILLNGKPVFLKGFNRHEDYNTYGCAIPVQAFVEDMNLMQDLGSNAVRTCHYPNDERFLDLCDERGMMVWEENHARGFVLERMLNPNFEKQCEDCIDEMIYNHFNHPAIVIWGILNECASETEEGRRMYKTQFEQIKSLDSSRPTTFATCRHFNDICLDLPDVISFNIYTGWYQDMDMKVRHEQEMDWIASAGGAGKPVIVSEFGAGGIYGFRDRARSKWSEERQADLIRENLELYREDERITGTFIWQFADCRVTEEEWFDKRPRSHNNKGVVDEYRRPKLAYDVVKEIFPTMQPSPIEE